MTTTIEDVLASLSASTREKVYLAQDSQLNRLELPSLGINLSTGGGLGYRRLSLIWGNQSAGKSGLCLQAIAKAQEEGKLCAWIDAEKAYDAEWAEKLGVDNSKLILSTTGSTSHMTEVVSDLMESGVDIIVVDSISELLPNSYFEGDEIKDFDDTSQIGAFSKDLGKAINILTYRNQKTAIIFISQVRTQLGNYQASLNWMGGKAMEHGASTIIKLWSSKSSDDEVKGEVVNGNMIFKKAIGHKIRWTINKNKIGPPAGNGEYNFMYQGDNLGIDLAGEVLDLAVLTGSVKKGGSWYALDDENRFQVKDNAIKYLRENPYELERLYKEIIA
jgi:recombination protein RecA